MTNEQFGVGKEYLSNSTDLMGSSSQQTIDDDLKEMEALFQAKDIDDSFHSDGGDESDEDKAEMPYVDETQVKNISSKTAIMCNIASTPFVKNSIITNKFSWI